MEIMFAIKIKEDGKTVQMQLLCTDCRGELDVPRASGLSGSGAASMENWERFQPRSLLTDCSKLRRKLEKSMAWASLSA